MSVPISMLWGTRIRLKKKITLGVLFSLTVITIIVAIIRGIIVNTTTGIPDLSWIYVWSAIEASILCVASIRGLFTNQDAVRPARYEPPGSSIQVLRNIKSKRNRVLHTLDSLTGVATQTTYIRAGDSGSQSGPPSVRSEEPIIALEGVKVKQRYEVTHEHL
ncbi:integral membrane protein [Rutstroemia sp. NJR-2017a WRK4]|nr:integral membrane protein [Rutstroemia sp. NJR-2017a WRK4]